jgi:exopolysaccharide biosynthesis protein
VKKIAVLVSLLIFLAINVRAETISRIRIGSYPEKIRLVFDFDGTFSYQLEESKEKIIIFFPGATALPEIQNYVELNDIIVRYLEVERADNGLKVTIPLSEPVPYNIFSLGEPPRLVIDFDREFTNLISGGIIIDGVENLKVSKSTQNGRVSANVLKVDLNKAEVIPALAGPRKPNVLESFIGLFTPLKEKDDHFYRARVSDIAEEEGAIAAINGTYFAANGKPLGTLLIDRELVSTPLYDRTALIITDNRQAFIDNISIDSYFLAASGVRYDITGVNQGREKEATVLYSPVWGEKTGTSKDGIELVVSGFVVKDVSLGNSKIPRDGYVISLSGPASQFITENIRVGDKLDVHIKVVPFETSPQSILHMISGGPRLVKDGIPYVSKFGEKFKADIARGRAARTALGITKEGKLLLATVDGLPRDKSEKSSVGMTLEELSAMMVSLGAQEAMNLDGGSSTTMWIDGRVVNRPAAGFQQKVSNALLVRPRI